MTGVAHYTQFGGQEGIAPVAVAISHMGNADAAGTGYPVRLLLRYYGHPARTKPRIPEYEPRRIASSFLLAYQ